MVCVHSVSVCSLTLLPRDASYTEVALHLISAFNARVKELNLPLSRLALFLDPRYKGHANYQHSHADTKTLKEQVIVSGARVYSTPYVLMSLECLLNVYSCMAGTVLTYPLLRCRRVWWLPVP